MGVYSGAFNSLIDFNNSPFLLFIISILIVLGGLGFPVMINISSYYTKGERLSLHTKLVLIITAILIVVPFFLFLGLEFNNEASIANMNFVDKISNSLFQIISPRTAGYNSLSLANLKEASLMLIIILMFIGASPVSTGGGIKTITFAVLILSLKAFIKNKTEINMFGKRISRVFILKSLAIFIIASFSVIIGSFIILSFEPHFNILESVFEVTSALATVGLSIGGTAKLSVLGRFLIILYMFIGRVGLITFVISLLAKKEAKEGIRYPEEKLIIG